MSICGFELPEALMAQHHTPLRVLGPANWSWKWLSTPAGCCSCGCNTESTEMKRVQRLAPLLPNSSAHTHARKRPRECGSTPVRVNQHTYTQLRVILRKGQCRGARGAPCVTLMWTTGASLGLCLHLPHVFNRASIVQVAWKRFIITPLLCGSLNLSSFFSAIMCVDVKAYSISSIACAQVVWDVVFPTFFVRNHSLVWNHSLLPLQSTIEEVCPIVHLSECVMRN